MSEPLTQGEAFGAIGRAIQALHRAVGEGGQSPVIHEALQLLGIEEKPPAEEPTGTEAPE